MHVSSREMLHAFAVLGSVELWIKELLKPVNASQVL